MVGRTDGIGGDVYLWDNERPGYNVVDLTLAANSTMADYTATEIDILSNGFKLRTTGGDTNQGLFVYWAFAETPFVSNVGESLPTTAR